IAGSLLWSLLSRNFRIEWFASFADFRNHVFGAILMGFGGVLAMGCTIGQGITGMATLALGSFLALVSIVFGSAITMRVQYYKLVYEADASFVKALLSSLVDFKLLPEFMRKLEAI
ncbi:MAG: YeeE/YedE thiosulfate transporter family protein, partial [Sulfuriferula sp.]